jgi:molybdenum cofactor biosynthesis enzyme MoaA
MIKLADTLSLCEHCYRHVPAVRFERDGAIWLGKTCKHHEYVEHLVEPDAEFYKSFGYNKHKIQTYLIEVTNKCNLACPHCYQMPDNMSKDPPIDYLLSMIQSWPDDGYAIALCGAEPTARKDLPELITAIKSLPGKSRRIMVLTNGVNLAKKEYAEQFVGIDDLLWTIGLNHPDYQGTTVRKKQMDAMDICKELGLHIKNISYTLYDLTQLEYCLKEIQEFGSNRCEQFRIRVGADIGRTPNDHTKVYLSELVSEVKNYCEKYNWNFERDHEYLHTNKAHFSTLINGIRVKIIQWPDAKTLDLSEMQTESWAEVVPGIPRSPLVHQVILRDGAINKGLPLWDKIPKEWLENYDKPN